MKILGDLIANVAPLLGGAIAGPAGATIASMVSKKFGCGDSEKEILEKIKLDGNSSIKLIEIQNEHEIQLNNLMIQYEIQKIQSENSEKDSARKREVELAKSGYRDWTPTILAYFTTIMLFSILGYLCSNQYPRENSELISGLVGVLSTAWIGCMSYFYGKNHSYDSHITKFREKNGK